MNAKFVKITTQHSCSNVFRSGKSTLVSKILTMQPVLNNIKLLTVRPPCTTLLTLNLRRTMPVDKFLMSNQLAPICEYAFAKNTKRITLIFELVLPLIVSAAANGGTSTYTNVPIRIKSN